MKVAVLGAGLMGSQVGAEYALGGHEVVFLVRRPEEARKRVAATFSLVRDLRLRSDAEVAGAEARTTFACEFHAVSGSALIAENLAEDFGLKVEFLRRAAEAAPNAVLATNTSSLSVTELGVAVGRPERTIGTHYWNPPLLMPLVEIVVSDQTAAEVVDLAVATLRALGKRPLHVQRDVPGFVWNRLQIALLREAVWLVEQGVATPEAVDEAVRYGLARRWRSVGVFEAVALGGAETWSSVANRLLPFLSVADRIDALAAWIPSDPQVIEEARGRRDAALAASAATEENERA